MAVSSAADTPGMPGTPGALNHGRDGVCASHLCPSAADLGSLGEGLAGLASVHGPGCHVPGPDP